MFAQVRQCLSEPHHNYYLNKMKEYETKRSYLHLLATLVSPEPCIAHFLGTHSQTLNSAVWQIAKR